MLLLFEYIISSLDSYGAFLLRSLSFPTVLLLNSLLLLHCYSLFCTLFSCTVIFFHFVLTVLPSFGLHFCTVDVFQFDFSLL